MISARRTPENGTSDVPHMEMARREMLRLLTTGTYAAKMSRTLASLLVGRHLHSQQRLEAKQGGMENCARPAMARRELIGA